MAIKLDGRVCVCVCVYRCTNLADQFHANAVHDTYNIEIVFVYVAWNGLNIDSDCMNEDSISHIQ